MKRIGALTRAASSSKAHSDSSQPRRMQSSSGLTADTLISLNLGQHRCFCLLRTGGYGTATPSHRENEEMVSVGLPVRAISLADASFLRFLSPVRSSVGDGEACVAASDVLRWHSFDWCAWYLVKHSTVRTVGVRKRLFLLPMCVDGTVSPRVSGI